MRSKEQWRNEGLGPVVIKSRTMNKIMRIAKERKKIHRGCSPVWPSPISAGARLTVLEKGGREEDECAGTTSR